MTGPHQAFLMKYKNFEAVDLAEKIKLALLFPHKTNGRNNIQNFDNQLIAKKVYSIYHKISSEK